MLKFDEVYWRSNLTHPDWYIRLEKELTDIFFPVIHDNPDLKSYRHKVYRLVDQMLINEEIPLAVQGPNFDQERKPVNKLVIHHTEEDSNLPASRISAIGLLRLYSPKYIENDILNYKIRGKAIWSGHFNNGLQVFYGYHWCVYPDGKTERWLADKLIGWHSGEWGINRQSVGIALAGNYEHGIPPLAQLQGCAQLIKREYRYIQPNEIVGHLEVKAERTCPGDKFITGWKEKLLDLASE